MDSQTIPTLPSEASPRTIVHGINNQLSILLGYLQLITQAPQDAAQVERWGTKATVAYRKLETLIQELDEYLK